MPRRAIQVDFTERGFDLMHRLLGKADVEALQQLGFNATDIEGLHQMFDTFEAIANTPANDGLVAITLRHSGQA